MLHRALSCLLILSACDMLATVAGPLADFSDVQSSRELAKTTGSRQEALTQMLKEWFKGLSPVQKSAAQQYVERR